VILQLRQLILIGIACPLVSAVFAGLAPATLASPPASAHLPDCLPSAGASLGVAMRHCRTA